MTRVAITLCILNIYAHHIISFGRRGERREVPDRFNNANVPCRPVADEFKLCAERTSIALCAYMKMCVCDIKHSRAERTRYHVCWKAVGGTLMAHVDGAGAGGLISNCACTNLSVMLRRRAEWEFSSSVLLFLRRILGVALGHADTKKIEAVNQLDTMFFVCFYKLGMFSI